MAGLRSRLTGAFGRLGTSLRRTCSPQALKSLFTTRSFTAGGYTALTSVVVIAIAIVVVLAVEALPTAYTNIDISEAQTTTISEETEEYLSQLEDDITIYLIATEGDEDEYIQVLLERYAAASDHVVIEQRDPELYPGFTSQYTSDSLSDNSLIITCGDSSKVLDYYDIYTLNTATYSYEFSGESVITSAIKSLTGTEMPKIYLLTGHGEADLTETYSSFISSVEQANIEIEELNLLSEGSVPDDADAVIMYAPQSDLSDDETDALLEYIDSGGGFMLVTDYLRTDMPNVDTVMDSYGLEAVDGLVIEGDASRYVSGYPYYILPTIESSDITQNLYDSNSYILAGLAHGIQEIDEYRSTLVIYPLLSTSTSTYVKADPANAETLEQEDDDVAGSVMLGAAVTEEVDDDTESRVVWISSTYFLDESLDLTVGGSNSEFMLSAVAWAAGSDVDTSSISGKDLGITTIVMDSATSTMLSVIVVGVIPLALLAAGFIVWRSRRVK